MSKVILLLCSIVLSTYSSFANENCFIAKQNGKVLVEQGDCTVAYSPNSTFKIPLSLMGFDSGFLKDETHPSCSLPEGWDPYINVCKSDHNPRTWMRDSC